MGQWAQGEESFDKLALVQVEGLGTRGRQLQSCRRVDKREGNNEM